MTYKMLVTEIYSKYYEVEADSEDEARELAEQEATDDMNLACPENMDNRKIEFDGCYED